MPSIGVFGGGTAYGRNPAARESLVTLTVLFKDEGSSPVDVTSPTARLQRARDNAYVSVESLSGPQNPDHTYPLSLFSSPGQYRFSFLSGGQMQAGLYNVEFLGTLPSGRVVSIKGNIEIGEISRVQDYINRVRISLMDDIPEHYRLDEHIHQWNVEQVYTFLREALGMLNTMGPRITNFAFDTFPQDVDVLLVRGACIWALYARSRFESAIQMNYSDQHTLNINRAADYKGLADGWLLGWKDDVKGYKQATPPTPIGLRSQRVPFRVFRVLGMLPNHSSFFSA